KNDWHVRHARRLLQERAAAGKLSPGVREELRKILKENEDVTRKLRALWALHVTGGLEEPLTLELLDHPSEYVRGGPIHLALEDRKTSGVVLDRLAGMARNDPSPWVRLNLASGLQRLPLAQRWPVAEALVRHGEDAEDASLPLMIWYGIEPLIGD